MREVNYLKAKSLNLNMISEDEFNEIIEKNRNIKFEIWNYPYIS